MPRELIRNFKLTGYGFKDIKVFPFPLIKKHQGILLTQGCPENWSPKVHVIMFSWPGTQRMLDLEFERVSYRSHLWLTQMLSTCWFGRHAECQSSMLYIHQAPSKISRENMNQPWCGRVSVPTSISWEWSQGCCRDPWKSEMPGIWDACWRKLHVMGRACLRKQLCGL